MPQPFGPAVLDEQLKEMVRALHTAINRAMPHLGDDPGLVDQAIGDCREILDVVLKGNVFVGND